MQTGRAASCCLLLHSVRCDACLAYLERLTADPSCAGHAVQGIVLDERTETLDARTGERAKGSTVLFDRGGLVAHAVGAAPPAWVAADAWGAIHALRHVGDAHAWPQPLEIGRWLDFIAMQCPECQGEAL